MKKNRIHLLLFISFFVFTGCSNAADKIDLKEVVPGIPAKDSVTLVDLGATTCTPCRMMMPILEKLKKEYQGRVKVLFIDVRDQANAGKAEAFKIMVIPTQIFYDRHGREVFRHVGFFDQKSITAKLEGILAQK